MYKQKNARKKTSETRRKSITQDQHQLSLNPSPVLALLKHRPALSTKLKVLDHLQETRSCPKCKQYIVTAEKPCPPIPGNCAGPRLLAEIIVGKLEDGLPNNRQQKFFGRQNVTIPRSTQSDWMQTTAYALFLFHDLQKQELLKSSIIKTDDSFIKIQDRKNKNNIRTGKITTYISDAKRGINMFDYSPDQTFDKNLKFLEDFKGITI